MDNKQKNNDGLKIAVVGMSGRFPGAKNLHEFWNNIKNGIESIAHFSNETLIANGIAEDDVLDENYIKSKGHLEDVEYFDAAFFNYKNNEAVHLSPQARIFHECAWEALEDSGNVPGKFKGNIGVYAGASSSVKWQLLTSAQQDTDVEQFSSALLNDKDYLCTRLSYQFNLQGPSVTVNTACSTSLVAIHLACRSLIMGECQMALAGGVAVSIPLKSGYFYEKGMINSSDGHCKPFDINANGTVFGDGGGVVALKRLKDAIKDGDQIYAVIAGSAINNDGNAKVGFTAPSTNGQARLIKQTHALAKIDPSQISYLECHGTGTQLGDPIEIQALKSAFKDVGKSQCAIGSVKSNVGHLDAAAGVSGFIKAVLAIKNKLIPPTINYTKPNPQIDIENSPFYVNDTSKSWETKNNEPRIAGVSSFGIGGTNAHIILEEKETIDKSDEAPPFHLLTISAKSPTALCKMANNLSKFIAEKNEENLKNVCYTLAAGREDFSYRKSFVIDSRQEVITALKSLDTKKIVKTKKRQLVFMFPGQGSQYVNMAQELFESQPVFAAELEQCINLVAKHSGIDIKPYLFSNKNEESDELTTSIQQTQIAQLTLFAVEYALAQFLLDKNIKPEAMIGHSIGEYVAACVAGIFSLEDAIRIVSKRGELMQSMPEGDMLSVSLNEEEISRYLDKDLSIAAVNGASEMVLSGNSATILTVKNKLEGDGHRVKLLKTSHAFHSVMMSPMLDDFQAIMQQVELKSPQIPVVSNLTGTWLSNENACDPGYWSDHLRNTVRFAAGLNTLKELNAPVFIEVGPGMTLKGLVLKHFKDNQDVVALNTTRHPLETISDSKKLLETIGLLWEHETSIDIKTGFVVPCQKVSLPTYPFERSRFWPETNLDFSMLRAKENSLVQTQTWELSPITGEQVINGRDVVAFLPNRLGARKLEALSKSYGNQIIKVFQGKKFVKHNAKSYTIDPHKLVDLARLFNGLKDDNINPQTLWHFLTLTATNTLEKDIKFGLTSIINIAKASIKLDQSNIDLKVISGGTCNVSGAEKSSPEKTMITGTLKSIIQEFPAISAQCIDVLYDPDFGFVDSISNELLTPSNAFHVAYRGVKRWESVYKYESLPTSNEQSDSNQEEDLLFIDGLNDLGFKIADLIQEKTSTYNFTTTSPFPAKRTWDKWLAGDKATIEAFTNQILPPIEKNAPSLMREYNFVSSLEKSIEKELGIADLSSFNGFESKMRKLCASIIIEYLQKGGITLKKGEEYNIISIQNELGVIEKFKKFYLFFISVLEEENIVDRIGDDFTLIVAPEQIDKPDKMIKELEIKYPEFKGMYELLQHCSASYVPVMSGKMDAVNVLYPDGSSAMYKDAENRIVEYTHDRVYCGILAEIVQQKIKTSKGERTFKILEIGAGECILTQALMPHLEGANVSYHFTDIGLPFIAKAKKEASKHMRNFMEFKLFDISKDPCDQGIPSYEFDLVIGLNVVHATKSIKETITNLKKLLTPGGDLAIIENVKPEPWLDLVWGLADGWWNFEDYEIRNNSPLLKLHQWEKVFNTLDFEDHQLFPSSRQDRLSADTGLLIARQGSRQLGDGFYDKEKKVIADKVNLIAKQIKGLTGLEAKGKSVHVIDRFDVNKSKKISDKLAIKGVVKCNEHPLASIASLNESAISSQVLKQIKKAQSDAQILDNLKSVDWCWVVGDELSFYGAYENLFNTISATIDLPVLYEAFSGQDPKVKQVFVHKETLDSHSIGCRTKDLINTSQYLDTCFINQQKVTVPTRKVILEEKEVKIKGIEPNHGSTEHLLTPSDKTRIEKELVALWRGYLATDQVGPTDNLFELGVTSLDIIQISKKLKAITGEEITALLMFKFPTVRSLATYLVDKTRSNASSPVDKNLMKPNVANGRNNLMQRKKLMLNSN